MHRKLDICFWSKGLAVTRDIQICIDKISRRFCGLYAFLRARAQLKWKMYTARKRQGQGIDQILTHQRHAILVYTEKRFETYRKVIYSLSYHG